MKLSVVITNIRMRKAVWGMLSLLFVAYVACRINVGRIRVAENSGWNDDIARAHSYAYIVWGLADLVIIYLVLYNAWTHFQNSNVVMGKVIKLLLKSSIPRLLFMGVNTLLITLTALLAYGSKEENVENFLKILWLIKAAYSLILLFDMLSTKGLLVEATSVLSKTDAPAKKATATLEYSVNDITSQSQVRSSYSYGNFTSNASLNV